MPTKTLTWADLVAREPRLADLMRDVQRIGANAGPGFCANAVWYGYQTAGYGLKRELMALVGWERWPYDPELNTATAYDLAYTALYDALPDCRHDAGC